MEMNLVFQFGFVYSVIKECSLLQGYNTFTL